MTEDVVNILSMGWSTTSALIYIKFLPLVIKKSLKIKSKSTSLLYKYKNGRFCVLPVTNIVIKGEL